MVDTLMDIRMPKLDGITATRRITATPPAPAVLILTTFDDEEYVLGAVRAGAAGFLLKDAGPDVLVGAVRTVQGGDSLVDPAVTRTLIAHCLTLEARARVASSSIEPGRTGTGAADGTGPAADWRTRLDTLSDREGQIFIGMARGRSNRELATQLVVSETTVKSHVSAVLAKLGLRSRVEAVVLAYESGVITPGDGLT